MSSTVPPTTASQGTPNAGGNKSDNVTIALALILVGVIALLLLVAINDDNDTTVEVTAGDTTATTQGTSSGSDSGDSGSGGSGGSGGELPPGEYEYVLTADAGTVQYRGSCNVVEGRLSASGGGAQGETITLSADVIAQTGSAQVAAVGSEFEGTINSASIGESTFEVAGVGSVADDSAEGSGPFTVAGGCNTSAAGGGGTPTPSPTPSVEPSTHEFTATIPEGTAALSGTCVVVDGQLTVDGSGQAGETLSISANSNDQTGSMAVAAAGVSYEGTVTAVSIGEGTFEVTAMATPADDSATGQVEISAAGGCDT